MHEEECRNVKYCCRTSYVRVSDLWAHVYSVCVFQHTLKGTTKPKQLIRNGFVTNSQLSLCQVQVHAPPLHQVQLCSKLIASLVNVAVCQSLPVEEVNFILGNNLAGGNMLSDLE